MLGFTKLCYLQRLINIVHGVCWLNLNNQHHNIGICKMFRINHLKNNSDLLSI